ncbi:MAG TPA: TonB-dependent receptor [Steroidobacteraceae bacterium]|nr:TonB-dependent receptor [Steroidobacteraceae bacterium]
MSKITVGVPFVRASIAAVLGAATLVGFSAQVVGAEADDEEDVELEEVQVTGTRIQNPNVTSANPITSISGDEMRQLGFVNVADALTQLVPQNISTYQPTMIGDNQSGSGGAGVEQLERGSFFIGQTIANLRGMDGVFGSRTLTLIDGRRSVSTSNQADVVDMNIIPSNLLQRMDVVTGGASATYGSGAMAGVVNMVLNNRMTGVNVDLDYGVNEAGDGGSPHVSISGGMPLLGGRAHMLLGGEWQDTKAIRDCANARSWCAESRTLFTNSSNLGSDPSQLLTPLPGYENMPARFEMSNVRYNQYSPNGVIYANNASLTTGYRFSDDGSNANAEPFAYGFRGGVGFNSSVMNGDGPLLTSETVMRPSSERKTLFTNFEYNITEQTTAYLQGNYARTEGVNKNAPTVGTYCARFDSAGTVGQNAVAGTVWNFSTTTPGIVNGLPYIGLARSSQLNMAPTSIPSAVIDFLGLPSGVNNVQTGNGFGPNGTPETARRGVAFPFWIPVALSPNPPTFNFNGNAVGRWVRYSFQTYEAPRTVANFYTDEFPNDYWLLETVTLTQPFENGTNTVLPNLGRNAYAFLNNLAPDALVQVQNAFNNSITSGSGAGASVLYGGTPCNGYTAIRKVWEPQFSSYTGNEVETMRFVGGVKGRFGGDWRWDAYFQYGETKSSSFQTNVATNLRLAWAMDAVIDDRVTLSDGSPNPSFGQPVCRVTRDGVPVLDTTSRPLTQIESLQALGAACQPLNVFGSTFSDPVDAARQQQALDYAFVDTGSSGTNSLSTLSISTNGTLWEGWAGPLSGAFGLEVREDKVDNAGTKGDFYLRADLARNWADAFGGKTRVTEAYTEFNLPIVSGIEAVNLFSVNLGGRYASYHNKGGAGTTGESATQNVFNWKASALYEPFDFMRFRVTRSRDLRAATYRDLFIFQPGVPDEFTVNNPWRERSVTSNENQIERWGQVRVGNADLKPEKSDTLTVGVVLSPGGWAQGMRLSVDYYDITVKDGINVPFNALNPARACFEESGNRDPEWIDGNLVDAGERGFFAENLASCQQLRFAPLRDSNGNPIAGTRDLQDLESYNSARPQNSLPVWRQGVDASLSYNFPLSRAFESLPGSVALSIRAQRALKSAAVRQEISAAGFANANPDPCGAAIEAADPQNNTPGYRTNPFTGNPIYEPNGFVTNRYTCVDFVGQIRSSTFIPGAAATPKWTGNFTGTYMVGDLTASLSARYIGGARMDNTWCDTGEDCANYQDDLGRYLSGSVDNNWVDPYFNFSLNGQYDLKVGNLKQFQVFGSINNLFDKSPPFTGGGISGATANYHDIMGRSYRMGVRMKF